MFSTHCRIGVGRRGVQASITSFGMRNGFRFFSVVGTCAIFFFTNRIKPLGVRPQSVVDDPLHGPLGDRPGLQIADQHRDSIRDRLQQDAGVDG